MNRIVEFLNHSISLSKDTSISVKSIVFVIVVLFITSLFLKYAYRLLSRRLEEESKSRFYTIFNFGRWLIYTIIFLTSLHITGVNVTAILASAAALLIGIGLALQTLFQDVFSGIFILVDKTAKVGDVIEFENQTALIQEINLRTTRAVMLSNKIISIPNHLFLTHKLTNWTQNGKMTREDISVRVSHNSDIHLVKKLLIQIANEHPKVEKTPPPLVLFEEIEESAFIFRLFFTVMDSFNAREPKSDIRFEIVERFRKNSIVIPFPQREVHLSSKTLNS